MSGVKVSVEDSRIAMITELPKGNMLSFVLNVQDVDVTETTHNVEYRVHQIAKISCKNIEEVHQYLDLFGQYWVTVDSYQQGMEVLLYDSWRYGDELH